MAARRSTTLTPVELEFMQVVWPRDEVSAEDVQEALKAERRNLAGGTVRKMLSILVEKGYVTRRRESYTFYYKATVGREQSTRKMVLDLLKRAFGGKAAPMVAALLDSRAVRERDIKEIERLIAERKGKERKG